MKTSRGVFWADPASNFGTALVAHGAYEQGMTEVLEAVLREGSVFVDLGANEGYFSVIAAQLVGNHGRVIAIEPQRRLKTVIERNLTLNDVHNVSIMGAAISDRAGSATLYLAPDTNTGATGLTKSTRYHTATDTVTTQTLEEALECARVDQIDLIKIDIEGFEYEALMGATELLHSHRIRAIALELHPWILQRRGLDANAILNLLRTAGYEVDGSLPGLVFRC